MAPSRILSGSERIRFREVGLLRRQLAFERERAEIASLAP